MPDASQMIGLRIGVDVGGTSTDAVALDLAGRLVAKAKTPTTADVGSGIASAIDRLLSLPEVDPRHVTHLMIGTTSAAEAIAHRRDLERVAVLRIGAPATSALPPLALWPAELAEAISAGTCIVAGGTEADGTELAPLDEDAIRRFAAEVAGRTRSVAIASVFSLVSAEHERRAEQLVRESLGDDVQISLSHRLGQLGLRERENATVLNAALVTVAHQLVAALEEALRGFELAPATFFSQNDGTLMTLEHAERHPVLTVGSGPANSMRGAALLTGVQDALVIDAGGATTEIGELLNGFPRERAGGGSLGGVPTNFRMPDLVSVPIGGGTILRRSGGRVALGPANVGQRLREDALAFGGSVPTLTDAAAFGGRVGDGALRPASRSRRALLDEGLRDWDETLAEMLDRAKLAAGPQPLIVVGGASGLVPDGLPGVSETLRPGDDDVANAIGAAMAMVSGQVDRVYPSEIGRERILEEVHRDVVDQTILVGGDPARVQVSDVQEISLGYLPSPAVRVRARAIAPIAPR